MMTKEDTDDTVDILAPVAAADYKRISASSIDLADGRSGGGGSEFDLYFSQLFSSYMFEVLVNLLDVLPLL